MTDNDAASQVVRPAVQVFAYHKVILGPLKSLITQPERRSGTEITAVWHNMPGTADMSESTLAT